MTRAWVFDYLEKPGKNLESLEKAIMRMTKAQVLERVPEEWGITLAHSKVEMVSIILTELQNMGHSFQDEEAADKEETKEEEATEEGTDLDPIAYAMENGKEALALKLEIMDLETLRAIILAQDMDPCRQYRQTKNADKLREVVKVVTASRMEKGEGFITPF